MASEEDTLESEIESWKGFPWALRKEDKRLWEEMVQRVRDGYAEAVERSGKPLMVDPFFMALLLEQQKMIRLLEAELNLSRDAQTTL